MRAPAPWIAAASIVVGMLGASACALYGDDDDDEASCVWQGRTYPRGQIFPAGDGCNTCRCEADGSVACTLIGCDDRDAGAPASCTPTAACVDGPLCGEVCCDVGETCVAGACRCGSGPACAAGDQCAAAGPVGEDGCGAVCCGASGPCPQ